MFPKVQKETIFKLVTQSWRKNEKKIVEKKFVLLEKLIYFVETLAPESKILKLTE